MHTFNGSQRVSEEGSAAPYSLTRRQLLSAVAASALCVTGVRGAGRFDTLHLEVAAQAKALAAGRALRLRLLLPAGCEANVAPLIKTFYQLTGIEIETISTPVDDINTKMTLDRLTDTVDYDLALPATFGLPDLVHIDAIQPLTEYAQKYEPAGLREGVLYETGDRFDGDIYGFQTDGDAYVMFYHREMLESPVERQNYEERFSTPLEVPQTWSELDRQIEYFHRPQAGRYGGLLFRTPRYLAWEWWIRYHAKGYWPLSTTLKPQINSDAGVEALEEMIRVTQFLVPEAHSVGLFGNWQRYSQGDIYCNIGWGGTQKYLNGSASAMQGKMVFGPTPGGIIDDTLLFTPYFNWGWNYVVTSGSALPELSYLFALFASTPVMSTLSVSARDGFFDPFRPEHYVNEAVIHTYSKDFLEVHEKSIKSSIPDLYIANQGQYLQTLSNWLQRALTGTVSAKNALDRVAEHWELITSRTDKKQQQERWRKLRTKYPPSVQKHLRDL